MSFDRAKYGKIDFCCDGCGEVQSTKSSDFREALDEVKALGWRARKVVKEWMHFCETCEP